uniref:Max-binding protein MNT n=1 Tax=Ornithodoros turicata TaxID=34597 RepID=A0A2R5LLX1_9ACAR
MSLDTLLEAAKYIEYRSEAKARGEIPQDYQTFALLSRSNAEDIKVNSRQQFQHASKCDNSSDSFSSNHCDDSKDKRRSGGAGTREVHNKLEKNRRAHLKECFETLKRQLPNMDDRKTSNLTILRGALRYIQSLKRREREYEHEMERLAREKIAAQQRLASLKKELSLQLDYLDISSILPEQDNETTTTASECGNYSDLDDDPEVSQELPATHSPSSPPSSPKPSSYLCDTIVSGNPDNPKPLSTANSKAVPVVSSSTVITISNNNAILTLAGAKASASEPQSIATVAPMLQASLTGNRVQPEIVSSSGLATLVASQQQSQVGPTSLGLLSPTVLTNAGVKVIAASTSATSPSPNGPLVALAVPSSSVSCSPASKAQSLVRVTSDCGMKGVTSPVTLVATPHQAKSLFLSPGTSASGVVASSSPAVITVTQGTAAMRRGLPQILTPRSMAPAGTVITTPGTLKQVRTTAPTLAHVTHMGQAVGQIPLVTPLSVMGHPQVLGTAPTLLKSVGHLPAILGQQFLPPTVGALGAHHAQSAIMKPLVVVSVPSVVVPQSTASSSSISSAQ